MFSEELILFRQTIVLIDTLSRQTMVLIDTVSRQTIVFSEELEL